MQALSPEQYDRLRGLATAWSHRHLKAAKAEARFNPRLVADALCFQCHREEEGETLLVGALITPLSLSLAVLPSAPDVRAPPEGSVRRVRLPSGEYALDVERLDDGLWLWRRELLDDLGDVGSREQASRLAQQLMERVMTPLDDA